jgi:3-oxoacyl-[acyl-carrier-protein] synthase II
MSDAVWITGVGVVSPLGHSLESLTSSLLAGTSATRQLLDRQGDKLVPVVGSQVDAVPVPSGVDPAAFAALGKLRQMALWCGAEALDSAGLRDSAGLQESTRELRVGIVIGQGGEWYRQWLSDWLARRDADSAS